jgi:uncharacterized protein
VDDTPAGRRIVVHKLNRAGAVAVTYEATLAERLPDGVRLEATWTRPPLALGYTTFETGDRFIEWYYADRWYNIFEIHAANGGLKGWYCNIAEPAQIGADAIRYCDLLLDLWVRPNGETLPLDEDEFAAEPALTAEQRSRALAALAALQRLVRERRPPFDTLHPSPPAS